jgi:two-component system invasion response regulator UvrY
MTLSIRVGIVDDHGGVREGIRNLLASAKDIVVIGEGENGVEAIQLAEQQKPDVLLLDVELPIIRGDVVMQHLHETKAGVKVLAISSYSDPAFVQGMLENGAAGYITKEEAPHYLVEAVRSIVTDQLKWISPIIANQISKIELEDVSLSGREMVILRRIILGETDNEVRTEVKIEGAELKKLIRALMAKFEVHSRWDLKKAAECVLSTAPT